MTLITKTGLTCDCGHEGAIVMRENDRMYSKLYESYRLEGFRGGAFTVHGWDDAGNIQQNLDPICPDCGAEGAAIKTDSRYH